MTWGVVMVSSRWRWVRVPLPAAATTRMVEVTSSLVRRHKSTSFGSLQQHRRRRSPRRPDAGKGCLAHMVAHAARGNSEGRSLSIQPRSCPRSSSSIITITRLLSGQVTTGRRGGRRRLVVDSCATSGREEVVGGVRCLDVQRASVGCSRGDV